MATPTEPQARIPVRRSNKNYDELIREYIRAARERLEAAKRASPSTATTPNGTSVVQQTFTPASTHHTLHDFVQSPPANWPLPAQRLSLFRNSQSRRLSQPRHIRLQTHRDAPESSSPQIASELSMQEAHHQLALSISSSDTSSLAYTETSQTQTNLPLAALPDIAHNQSSRRLSPEDADPHTSPPRQASIGRSHKAVLTTISPHSPHSPKEPDVVQDAVLHEPPMLQNPINRTRTVSRYSLTPAIPSADSRPLSGLSLVPRALQHASSRSSMSVEMHKPRIRTESTTSTPAFTSHLGPVPRPDTATSAVSSTASFRLGNIPSSEKQSALSERVGAKRPAPLNLGAVNEAETRGSLTSLPDLIQRALKLASNLEKGRTASRLGHDWLSPGLPTKQVLQPRGASAAAVDRSLPTTPLHTSPVTDRRQLSFSPWPIAEVPQSNLRHGYAPSHEKMGHGEEKPRQKHSRRCCGMPLLLFGLILVIVFFLIIAAVLIPVGLIIIPEQRHAATPCQNNGRTFTNSDGLQQCLCVSGYTGRDCTYADNSGCVLMNTTSVVNATVGQGIPAVFEQAVVDYNITLDASILLGLFSTGNLSCASESQLITFSGLSGRFLVARLDRAGADAQIVSSTPPILAPRKPTPETFTSDGIILAMPTSTSTVTQSTTSTSVHSSAISSPTPSSGPTAERLIGFARVAVLLILQSSMNISEAQTAHSQLSAYFANPQPTDVQQLSLGGGWVISLSNETVSNENSAVFAA